MAPRLRSQGCRLENIEIDNDTLFEAASMSKPVFAYVVVKLCETGVMNLDTPLTKYQSRLDSWTAIHDWTR